MKRLLLAGSTGFVGKHLIRYLKDNTDWEVVCTTRDLTKGVRNQGAFDYIVNLASISSVEGSIKNPIKVIENNVSSTLRLLDYARLYRPEVFLHLSSVEVSNPRNPYAASKAAQEAIASAYQATYGVPVVIVTSSNIVGPNQPDDRFIPKLIKQISAGETVKVYTHHGDIGSRVYNPVANVVDAICFILQMAQPSVVNRYSINGGENVTNLGLAQRIAKLLDRPLNYELVDATSIRPGYTSEFAQSDPGIVGWKPPQTLDEGLQWIK